MNRKKWYLILILSLFAANMLGAAPEVIRSGDIISIWVKGESELSVERQVGADGSISFPLLGNVGVNNLKTSDVAKLISQMLEDGYLREPLVQVTVKAKKGKNRPPTSKAKSLNARSTRTDKVSAEKPVLIEIIDGSSRKGISGVAMMLGNRIYQSNRLGQILVDSCEGRIVLIADEYEILSGDISSFLKQGNPPRIYLEKVQLPEAVTFRIVDAFTRKPLSGVDVTLDKMNVSTNKNGIFKIKKLQKEFGEVSLRKRGYKSHRMVVDFKGPAEQLIMMVRNE